MAESETILLQRFAESGDAQAFQRLSRVCGIYREWKA